MDIRAILQESTISLKKDIDFSCLNSCYDNYKEKKINYDNDDDIKIWCELVNGAYEEENYSVYTAKQFLKKHPFIMCNETIILFDNMKPIGTISYGCYITKQNVGGVFRIAVHKAYQRRGIGLILLKYAEKILSEKGMYRIESLIKLKRAASLAMHFKAGYTPVNIKYRAVPLVPSKSKNKIPFWLYCLIINSIVKEKYYGYCIKAFFLKYVK